MIDLTIQKGVLSLHSKAELMNDLCDIVLKWEGFADDEKAKQLAFSYIHEIERENTLVAGQTPSRPYYRVDITVPENAISNSNKSDLIGEVTDCILKAEQSGCNSENRSRVWCIIHHVLDGNWGGKGKVFPYNALRNRLLKAKKNNQNT